MVSKILLIVVATFNGDTITSATPYESLSECWSAAAKLQKTLPLGYESSTAFCTQVILKRNT